MSDSRIPASVGHTRRAMTLIEMLVATTMALIVMGVVAQLFSAFGNGVTNSQSLMELNARMRSTAWRLRQDLKGATAPTTPPLSPDTAVGYFEIIEGPRNDLTGEDINFNGVLDAGEDLNGNGALDATLHTDVDDVLLFTTRNPLAPFTGRFESGSISSDTAEVAWFLRSTVPATIPPTYTLYRKQFLVLGYVGAGAFQSGGNQLIYATAALPNGLKDVYDNYDLSVALAAYTSGTTLSPNGLADLTRRERRFLHNVAGDITGASFPYPFIINHQIASISASAESLPSSHAGLIFDSSSPRFGEDVVMSNVLSFDIRAFDPSAPIGVSGNTAIVPGDLAALTTGTANGAYVDLGNGVNVLAASTGLPAGAVPRFAGYGNSKSKLAGSGTTRRTYDTWSTHYEVDGINQDADGTDSTTDEGTDGIDSTSPADGVIDDVGEQETSPPYPYPLRGIEVRIRCYEPSSKQIRQVTIRHTFVPH